MLSNTSVLLLAGGQSTRMGRDKGLIPYRHYCGSSTEPFTWVERSYHFWGSHFDRVYISVNSTQLSAYNKIVAFQGRLIEDSVSSSLRGPLLGLYSALTRYPGRHWVLAAVDMPFISAEIPELLKKNIFDHLTGVGFQTKEKVVEPFPAWINGGKGLAKIEQIFSGYLTGDLPHEPDDKKGNQKETVKERGFSLRNFYTSSDFSYVEIPDFLESQFVNCNSVAEAEKAGLLFK